MSCGHCVAKVTQALNRLPGLRIKNVAVGSATVVVPDDATANAALAAIQETGYTARILRPASATGNAGGCCGGGREKGKIGGGSCCGG
ncbi:MAG: cation transporter, partial [Planctomycetota bacterium]